MKVESVCGRGTRRALNALSMAAASALLLGSHLSAACLSAALESPARTGPSQPAVRRHTGYATGRWDPFRCYVGIADRTVRTPQCLMSSIVCAEMPLPHHFREFGERGDGAYPLIVLVASSQVTIDLRK